MPTVREFEDAAIEYCLDHSGVGVWAFHLEQVEPAIYDITVRLGGHYRGESSGVAVVRVTYCPQEQRFNCEPAESLLPEAIPVEESVYLLN